MARIAFATVGSAGDLFPLIPIAQRLIANGDIVDWIVPRSLGLYLRHCGLAAQSYGDGSELRAVNDDRLYSTDYFGWRSWSRTVNDYVLPTLAADVAVIEDRLDRLKPDVVVTSGFAVAARVAAFRRQTVQVECSIYPQHKRLALERSSFGSALRRWVSQLARTDDRAVVTRLAWGAPADVRLHDAALCRDEHSVGFPYWDALPFHHKDAAAILAHLRNAADRPTVLCTLGSFVGVAAQSTWAQLAEAVTATNVQAVFVGGAKVPAHHANEHILTVGYVPLSETVQHFDVVVHHGGLGTTFAALRAGRPAVVVPHAFDQPYNARLVEEANVGVDAQRCGILTALIRALNDESIRRTAARVGADLVPTDVAAERSANRIMQFIDRSTA